MDTLFVSPRNNIGLLTETFDSFVTTLFLHLASFHKKWIGPILFIPFFIVVAIFFVVSCLSDVASCALNIDSSTKRFNGVTKRWSFFQPWASTRYNIHTECSVQSFSLANGKQPELTIQYQRWYFCTRSLFLLLSFMTKLMKVSDESF